MFSLSPALISPVAFYFSVYIHSNTFRTNRDRLFSLIHSPNDQQLQLNNVKSPLDLSPPA